MITPLKISELVDSPDSHYIIPIYQRNYDWGYMEIDTLIRDLLDFTEMEVLDQQNSEIDNKKSYYLGSLIVSKRDNQNLKESNEDLNKTLYEVVDGQQRLTTLNLLYFYLSHIDEITSDNIHGNTFNLSFENRKSATETFTTIKQKNSMLDLKNYIASLSHSERGNVNIINGLKSISQILDGESAISFDIKRELFRVLGNQVIIFRVELPEGTDLNHYFEIMNSRGEQLEQHEIIKAKLINKLDEKNRTLFAKIWDACANFEIPVQRSLTKIKVLDKRSSIEESFVFDSFELNLNVDRLKNIFNKDGENSETKPKSYKTISELILLDNSQSEIKHNINNVIAKKDDQLISFPYFLQIALSIYLLKNEINDSESINLDDKKFYNFFMDAFSDDDTNNEILVERIKSFAMQLLKLRYLFDSYIIKKDEQDGRKNKRIDYEWVIKRTEVKQSGYTSSNTFIIDKESDNGLNKLIWLQSMFHVSFPAKNYKYWLLGTLYFLDNKYEYNAINNSTIQLNEYVDYLESMAKLFMFGKGDYKDRVISLINNKIDGDFSSLNDEDLKYPSISIYALNYIDYLLLKLNSEKIMTILSNLKDKVDCDSSTEPNDDIIEGILRDLFSGINTLKKNPDNYSDQVKNFIFVQRSSKEHFYPQNPDHTDIKDLSVLHGVGNLCLIGASENSALSNKFPAAKIQQLSDELTNYSLPTIKLYFLINAFRGLDDKNLKDSSERIESLTKFIIELIKHEYMELQVNN